jgi:tRNA(Ile)-lysidine synthetase-like protein
MWPAVLGPQGVVLDRRGIARLARLKADSPRGLRVPLSAGWEAIRTAAGLTFRRLETSEPVLAQTIPRRGRVRFGAWTFAVQAVSSAGAPDDAWSAWLPAEVSVHVRSWKDGDRIAAGPHGSPRRVKRFFSDRRIAANERKGWPVVIAGGEIIWIPGIRRVSAVAARSGRPARLVVCERIHV